MMKFVAYFFFVLIGISSSLIAQNSDMNTEAAKFYNEGNKLMKSGDYQGAVAQYDKALAVEKDYRIYYQKGVTLKKMNKLAESEDAFQKCIQANPNFELAYNGLGGAYYADNKFLEAAEAFKKFEQLTKKNDLKATAKKYISFSYTKLGQASKKDGNYEKAITYLNEAINYYKYDSAYLTLAETYIELSRYDDAILAADNALNNRDKISKGAPLYYKGLAFKKKGDLSKAKENFEAAKSDPNYKTLCDYELGLIKNN